MVCSATERQQNRGCYSQLVVVGACLCTIAPQLYCITMLNYETFLALGNLVAALVFDGERARIIVVVVMVFMMLAGGVPTQQLKPSTGHTLSALTRPTFEPRVRSFSSTSTTLGSPHG